MTMVMDYINTHPELGIKIHWSTITEYAAAVSSVAGLDTRSLSTTANSSPTHSRVRANLYSKPNLAASAHAYWTGYFTSEPKLKGAYRDEL
jgi:hypothetical protein